MKKLAFSRRSGKFNQARAAEGFAEAAFAPIFVKYFLNEQELRSSAEGQFCRTPPSKDGQGRLQHPDQQPFLHPYVDDDELEIRLIRAQKSAATSSTAILIVAFTGLRLDHRERLEGSRGGRVFVQQGFAPAGPLGVVCAGRFAGESVRDLQGKRMPPRWST